MTKTRSLPAFAVLAATVLWALTGCSTTASRDAYPVRPPITYAIVLFIGEGENLSDEARLHALSLARDTLLAAGIVTLFDRMITDVERAEQLYRARVENGVLTEIAGVPSVSNATTVVLSRPHYSGDRLFWDTSYPYGYPSSFDRIHGAYPLPGPGWGHPSYGRGYYDRRDRDRDRNKGGDQRDRDNRGDHRGGQRGDGQSDRDLARNRDRDLDRRPPRIVGGEDYGRRQPNPTGGGATFTPTPRMEPPPRNSPAPMPAPPPPPSSSSSSVDRSDNSRDQVAPAPERGTTRRELNE